LNGQASLFDQEVRLESETVSLSLMRDKRTEQRAVRLANKLSTTTDPIRRARIATELRDIAGTIVATSIRDASRDGLTWRQIAADLGVPFQTLYRRYGGA
jgi:hypothetical protein